MNTECPNINLKIAWEKYLGFETFSRDKGGDFSSFIIEWERKRAEAQSVGCQYSDLVLSLKLIEKANLGIDFIETIIEKVGPNFVKNLLPQVLAAISNGNYLRSTEDLHISSAEQILASNLNFNEQSAESSISEFDDHEEVDNGSADELDARSDITDFNSNETGGSSNEFLDKSVKSVDDIDDDNEHYGSGIYNCSQCSQVFKSKAKWERHFILHENRFQCSKCEKGFLTRNVLVVHMRRCQPGVTLGGNTSESSLGNVVKDDNDDSTAQDKISNPKGSSDGMVKKSNAVVSLKRENGLPSDRDKDKNTLSPCEICGKLLKELSMNNHLGTHNPKFKCNICNKLFSTKAVLKTHAETHAVSRDFICPYCGKTYKTKITFNIHVNTHTKGKSYICSWCGMKFFHSASWKLHVRSKHTGENAHQCSVCNKKFFTATKLKNHERTHTGERPYKCEYCGKTYGHRSSFVKHVRLIHSKVTDYREVKTNENVNFEYK